MVVWDLAILAALAVPAHVQVDVLQLVSDLAILVVWEAATPLATGRVLVRAWCLAWDGHIFKNNNKKQIYPSNNYK